MSPDSKKERALFIKEGIDVDELPPNI